MEKCFRHISHAAYPLWMFMFGLSHLKRRVSGYQEKILGPVEFPTPHPPTPVWEIISLPWSIPFSLSMNYADLAREQARHLGTAARWSPAPWPLKPFALDFAAWLVLCNPHSVWSRPHQWSAAEFVHGYLWSSTIVHLAGPGATHYVITVGHPWQPCSRLFDSSLVKNLSGTISRSFEYCTNLPRIDIYLQGDFPICDQLFLKVHYRMRPPR